MRPKRVLIVTTMFAVIAAAGSIYFVSRHEKNEYFQTLSKKSAPTLTQTAEPQNSELKDVTSTPTNNTTPAVSQTNLITSGWIPSFDFNNGLQSAIAHKSKLNSVHYAAASIAENGSISWGNGFETNLKTLNNTGIPFGLNVISISENASKNLITFGGNKDIFFNKLKEIKTANSNFKEINLNIEKLGIANKLDFVNFIKETKGILSQVGVSTVVTFYGQDSDMNNPYDYKGIGENADQVIIMAYDYTLKANRKAGFEQANAPDFWVEDITKYAVQSIPKEKITIGLPLYGYSFNTESGKRISSYTYSQIQTIQKNQTTSPKLQSNGWGEMYIDKGTERIYFQDKATLETKRSIVSKYGVTKVFYWRLGGEGDLLN